MINPNLTPPPRPPRVKLAPSDQLLHEAPAATATPPLQQCFPQGTPGTIPSPFHSGAMGMISLESPAFETAAFAGSDVGLSSSCISTDAFWSNQQLGQLQQPGECGEVGGGMDRSAQANGAGDRGARGREGVAEDMLSRKRQGAQGSLGEARRGGVFSGIKRPCSLSA